MRACRRVGLATLLLLGVFAFTPLTDYTVPPPPDPPRPGDAIVVLGSRIGVDGTLSAASMLRTVHGIRLYLRGLAPLLVMAGPLQGRRVEAEVRAELARELGVPAGALLTEPTGHTTRDEARLIAELLRPRAVRRIVVVTGSDHMVRAREQFEREGFEVVPAPVSGFVRPEFIKPEERLGQARRWLQELFGRLYYRAAAVFS